MQETEEYKLKKPDADDFFDIEDFNENTDKIEQALKENAEGVQELKAPPFDDSGTVDGINSFTDFLNSVKNKMNIFQFFKNFKAGMKFILHTGMIVDNYATKEKGFIPDATLVTSLKEQLDEQNNNIDGIFLNKNRFKFITTQQIDTLKTEYFSDINNGYVNYFVITNSTQVIGYESGDNIRGCQTSLNYDGTIKRRYKQNGAWTNWENFVINSDLYTKIVDANFVNGEVSITINAIDVTRYSWSAVGRTGMTIITSIIPENTNTLKLTARGWWDSTVPEGATRNIQLIGVKISS